MTISSTIGINVKNAKGIITLHQSNADIYLDVADSTTTHGVVGNALDNVIDATHINVPLNIKGGAGNDTVMGGNTTGCDLYGEVGNDSIVGSASKDYQWGGTGSDTMLGMGGDDSLLGGSGNDLIYGDVEQPNTSPVISTTNNDTIYGGAGDDTIYGGEGNDLIYGGAGRATIHGGTGNDKIYASEEYGYDKKLSVLKAKNGGSEAVVITGDDGNDEIWASNYNDLIEGGTGNDLLYGFGGNDTIYGGDGNDTIEGGVGKDLLNGGAGADKFIFITNGTDTIADYNAASGDTIEIRDTSGKSLSIKLVQGNYLKASPAHAATPDIAAKPATATHEATPFIAGKPATPAIQEQNAPTLGFASFDPLTHTLLVNTDSDPAIEIAVVLTGITDFSQITLA